MADLETFRAETRAWLEVNCPAEMRTPIARDADVCWGGRNARLTPAQRHTLLRRFHVHRVEADQVLLREGDRMEGMCLVQEGEIEVTRGQEPFEEVAGHLHAGMVCGETALLRAVAAPFGSRVTP